MIRVMLPGTYQSLRNRSSCSALSGASGARWEQARPRLHRQLVHGAAAEVLAVEPTLQVRVMAAALALDHPLGGGDARFVQFGAGDGVQQQVKDLALGSGRRLDDEGGVALAGVGVPLAAQGLHAGLQVGLVAAVQAAEEQVLEQVRQLLFTAREVGEADPTTSRIETCRRCSVGLSSTPMPFSSWKASTSLRWSAYDQGQSRQNSSRVDNERMGRAWNRKYRE